MSTYGSDTISPARRISTADAAHGSGTYKLVMNGQATIAIAWVTGSVSNQAYDASTNTTTADVALSLGLVARELAREDVAVRAFRAVTVMRNAPPAAPDGTTPRAKALSYFYLAQMELAKHDARKARVMAEKALAEDATLDAARELLASIRGSDRA